MEAQYYYIKLVIKTEKIHKTTKKHKIQKHNTQMKTKK